MKENAPLNRPTLMTAEASQASPTQRKSQEQAALKGASFDFSDLKRLQDNSKFEKARFSFRLYRK